MMTTAQKIELLRLGWEAHASAAYSEQGRPDAAARAAKHNLVEWCEEAALCTDVPDSVEDLVNWALAEARARSLRIRLGIQEAGDAPWYTGYPESP